MFPLTVSSLNNVNYLIHYHNQLTVVERYITNIAAIQNMGYYNKIDSTKSMGTYYWCGVKIPKFGYKEHGLKDIAFYVKKNLQHIG